MRTFSYSNWSFSTIIVVAATLFLSVVNSYAQETIRLYQKPKLVLHSWYPEYLPNPKLKIGESKILFTIVEAFEKTRIRHNDIDLITSNGQVHIEETDKGNQYFVKVGPINAKYVEFEAWFELGDTKVLIKNNGKWVICSDLYKVKDNRILLGTIKLAVQP
ncbi:hypothetical protein [Flavobacterium sp. GCM10027622]|uniref:hypothetical protein n=1 Tax=unclassified Flavobacterium TaxID=196869 RepID=UPI003606045B